MKMHGFTSLVAMIVMIAALAPIPAGAAPLNLLSNGSFELDADEDGLPDDWSVHKDARC